MELDLSSIAELMSQAAEVKVDAGATTISPATNSNYTPNSNGGFKPGGNFKKNDDLPNVYDDHKIVPTEVDKTKLKTSYAYSVVAIDENPSVELMEAMDKIVEFLKVKRFVYRYNGENSPTLAKNILNKQDLTMVDSYQVFLPWMWKPEQAITDAVVTSKRPTFLAGNIAKHFTKYTKKNPNNPEVRDTFYGFSQASGAIRNVLANNIHMYLGKDCLTKLSFMILYSADGVEKVEDINKDTTNRRAADVVKICAELGIQVFNIGKSDGPKRLLEHISKL